MKTKELIDTLNWHALLLEKRFKEYDYTKRDEKAINEIIKRLEELEELRFKLKNIHMKDYVDQSLIEELVKE